MTDSAKTTVKNLRPVSDSPATVPVRTDRQGDVWKDLDPRRAGRELKVISLVSLPEGEFAMVEPVGGGKPSRIALKNLRESATGKSGYRFMGNAQDAVAKAS